ncbi:MAG: hypothetical protein D6806_03745 [Deltaproteobacteria bacterium]|nr:MAG: hypothetical protein D6806_03745 [Deltaproteobacteria bacterium]
MCADRYNVVWLLLFALTSAGCSAEVGSVELKLVYPTDTGKNPLNSAKVKQLRATVYERGRPVASRTFLPSAGVSLEGVDVGGQRQVLVEGLGFLGEIVSWGISAPFEARSGQQKLFVFFGLVDAFSPPPSVQGLIAPDWPARYRIFMVQSRFLHSSGVFKDGRLLVTGGAAAPSPDDPAAIPSGGLKTADVFDGWAGAFANDLPSADCSGGTWCMNAPRAGHCVQTLDKNGFALIVGGEPPDPSWPQAGFDLSSGEFFAVDQLKHPRTRAACAGVEGIGAIIAGGADATTGQPTADVEVYRDGFFSIWPDLLSEARANPMVAVLPGTPPRLVIAGGWKTWGEPSQWQASDFVDVIDLGSDPPGRDSFRMLRPRADHSLVVVGKGSSTNLLVCGGRSDRNTIEPSCETLDVDTLQSAFLPVEVPRWRHTASYLPDGSVVVAGGFTSTVPPLRASAKALVLRLPGSRYEVPMVEPRALHTASVLPSGMLVLIGGISGYDAQGQVDFPQFDYEIYVPRKED